MLDSTLFSYRYRWPGLSDLSNEAWRHDPDLGVYIREMPESESSLRSDSRWPAFFPSPMCIVTTRHGEQTGVEKVIGASIVNRFPYIIGLSFCIKLLSDRHHPRAAFIDLVEKSRKVAIQFIPPGPNLDAIMDSILTLPEQKTGARLSGSGRPYRDGQTNLAPVFDEAYMVYEASLMKPTRDFDGVSIFKQPWEDVGSHRIYFFEIKAIQLRDDIARGESQIHWRSLPAWKPKRATQGNTKPKSNEMVNLAYQKDFLPNYAFPSSATTSFNHDEKKNGMAIKYLPTLPEGQIEIENDRARWPCFFPSSAGMITVRDNLGRSNVAPCGSTTIISRHPLVIAACISYAKINIRYASRASLDMIRSAGKFGCSVPYIDDNILDAIKYCGNVSFRDDPDKLSNSGLVCAIEQGIPRLEDMPVHYNCVVRGEVRLGTHIMFIGEVTRIVVRNDVSKDNPLEWCPWATVRSI